MVLVCYSHIIFGRQSYKDPDQTNIASSGRKCLPCRRTRSLTPLHNPLPAPIGERLLPYCSSFLVFNRYNHSSGSNIEDLAVFRASHMWHPTELFSEPGSYRELKIREMLGSVLAWKGWMRFPCPAFCTGHLSFENTLIRLLDL